MSHFLTIVSSDSGYIYDNLERYCEQTEDEEYLEFEDKTEELKEEYDGEVTAIKLPNGLIVEDSDSRFTKLYKLKNGNVYRKWFGKGKIDKRTKKCKKYKVLEKYPTNKIYKTFDEFATKGRYEIYHKEQKAYGYYYNPEGYYDWFSIGGRWSHELLVKKKVTDVIDEEPFLRKNDNKRSAPKGYKWVSGAKKCDIEWEKMRIINIKKAVRAYYRHKKIFESFDTNQKHLYRIDENCLYYWDTMVYKNGESLREYLERRGLLDFRKFINCYAFVNETNEWKSKGQMGWFGISTGDKDNEVWQNEVKNFLDEVDDEQYIIFVDCHI